MRAVLLVCVVLSLAACGGGGGGGGTPAESGRDSGGEHPAATSSPAPTSVAPEPTAPPSSAPPSSEPGAAVPEGSLTQDDDGARVQLTVGQEVSWQLSSDWDWLPPVSDGPAVELVPVDYLSDPGFQEWLLLGASEGTAQVTVEGLPACGDPGACPEQQVTLTVDVTG